MKVPLLIIGGGLSGLAAGIRFARYSTGVHILEKHNRVGGLNSYFRRNKLLLETGLHAITNYAHSFDKHAPLNRLFRQLKLKRKNFDIYPQLQSEIIFDDCENLLFSNDFSLLFSEIEKKFPKQIKGFSQLVDDLDKFNPFLPTKYISAKSFIHQRLRNELLTDMLLCPLMFYGSSVENDMDLSQFVIMFRSIYKEGMFRPGGNIKDFLDTLVGHFIDLGGSLKLNSTISKIVSQNNKVQAVILSNGEEIECDMILSTIGHEETMSLLDKNTTTTKHTRLGFIENIFIREREKEKTSHIDKTIIFYNSGIQFNYQRPASPVDLRSGVICFPFNFKGRKQLHYDEIRTTHLANFHEWEKMRHQGSPYHDKKEAVAEKSLEIVTKLIGRFDGKIIFRDTFTPVTIKRFTAKKEGAIYGSPSKIKDGDIGYSNLFLAGTDQGFLGIIGSMLSGVSIVNQHILPKL